MKMPALIIMVLTLVFTLAACSSAASSENSSSQTNTQQNITASGTDNNESQASEIDTESGNNDPNKTTDISASTSSEAVSEPEPAHSKTLVVYFSATGTTKGVAEQIASAANADIYEILADEPYSADDLNWNDSNSRSTKEQNDHSARPAIGSDKISLDDYSTIFIGFPIWWGEEPRIMDTFVESYDFTGKTLIPFCTSASSPIGSSGVNLAANAGSGNWLEGDRLSSSSDISGWVAGFGLSN